MLQVRELVKGQPYGPSFMDEDSVVKQIVANLSKQALRM
jgi:hypothetical protein